MDRASLCSPLTVYFIFRLRDAHQPMIEPADDVLQSLNAMPRLTRTRKLMSLVREAHHHGWNLSVLERAEHLFAAGVGRRAPIGFAENEHHRRRDFVDVSYWRTRFEIFRVFERRRFKP